MRAPGWLDKRCAGRLLIAVAAVLLSLPVATQPEPSQRQRDLERLRSDVADLEQQLQDVQASAQGLAGELESTRVELQLQRKRVAEAEAARDVAVEQVESRRRRVEDLEGRLATTREELQQRLAGLYRLGRWGYLRLLLSIEDAADPLRGVRALRYLARRDAEAIDRYADGRDRLRQEVAELEEQRRQVEAWAQQEEERRRQLSRLRQRQSRLLAQLQQEREQLAERAEALREKERKLGRLIDTLAGTDPVATQGEAQARAGDAPAVAAEPIQQFRGVLDWPLRGEIVEGYGTRRDPRYGTEVPHNGIEIAVPEGDREAAEVRVVYPGQVLFASPFEGYGTMVVVVHPDRVFSIYTGLDELQVAQGDVLSLASVVGRAGDRLYFEIRVENRPEDPQQWLR